MYSYRLFFLFVFIGLISLNGCDSSSDTPEEIIVQDISVGDGDEVFPGHTIIVGYVGKLEDGTVFDRSETEDDYLIFTLGVNNVIRGLDQGIPGMKVGGVRRIEIPPSLAFGRNGMCTTDDTCPVPPNATVIFDITIVDILNYVLKEDLELGTGDEVVDGSKIEVEYFGFLADGRQIASSDISGRLTFTVGSGNLITGIEQGVLGMKPGGVRELTIPPVLGYGPYGDNGGTIPPYALLRFRINLVGFVTN